KRMVEQEQLASGVDCSTYSGRYPGWFELRAELIKGMDLKKAEEVVLDELKKLCDKPVDATELKRVNEGALATPTFAPESGHGLVDSFARAVPPSDLEYLKTYLPRIQAVTAEEIQQVARKYFDPQSRVVVRSSPARGARREPAKKEDAQVASGGGLPAGA